MMAITGFISRHIYVINCEWVKETLKKSSPTFCSALPCASPLTGLARKFAPGEFFRDEKRKVAALAHPCARDAQGGASVAGGRMPRATGIRASCTARFSFFFIFQLLACEKSAGSGFSRQPRRGLAQGCVKQKWRHISCLKNSLPRQFFVHVIYCLWQNP